MPEVTDSSDSAGQRRRTAVGWSAPRWRRSARIGLVLLLIVGGVSATVVAVTSLFSLIAENAAGPWGSGKPRHIPSPSGSSAPSPSQPPSAGSPAAGTPTPGTPSPSDGTNSVTSPQDPGSTTIVENGLTNVTGSTSSVSIGATASIALKPGLSAPLNMSFSNQGKAAVTVDNVVVSIGSILAPASTPTRGCTASDFYIVQSPSSFSVALSSFGKASLSALGTPTSKWPVIGMVESLANQDGCKGASVNLAYSAWGHN